MLRNLVLEWMVSIPVGEYFHLFEDEFIFLFFVFLFGDTSPGELEFAHPQCVEDLGSLPVGEGAPKLSWQLDTHYLGDNAFGQVFIMLHVILISKSIVEILQLSLLVDSFVVDGDYALLNLFH